MTQTNKPEGRSFLHKLLIALLILVVFVVVIVGVKFVWDNYFLNTEEIYAIENIFVDINGDGLQDYIRYAEVIINKGDFTLGP